MKPTVYNSQVVSRYDFKENDRLNGHEFNY